MPANKPNEKQKEWNNQWWAEVVHKRKHALPATQNVRPRKKKKGAQKLTHNQPPNTGAK